MPLLKAARKQATASCLITVALMCVITARAQDCSTIPPSVRAALKQMPGWRIVGLHDLLPDDQELWEKARPGLCPGIATGNFESSTPSYAMALIKKVNGDRVEKLVLLTDRSGRVARIKTIVEPEKIISPLVVWSAPPGTYHDFDRTKEIKTARDSFVYEKLQSGARLYYVVKRRVYSLLISD